MVNWNFYNLITGIEPSYHAITYSGIYASMIGSFNAVLLENLSIERKCVNEKLRWFFSRRNTSKSICVSYYTSL